MYSELALSSLERAGCFLVGWVCFPGVAPAYCLVQGAETVLL